MVRTPSGSKKDLNRGAWTTQEDMTLINYIQTHGETGWRSLPKKAGLNRCGKSCRLRWLNYLRPDIKRGNISADEEELIIRMHRLLGNRWSLIAGRLPGRTDNEIKNYWNTHLSKVVKSRNSMRLSFSPQPKKQRASCDSHEDNATPSTIRSDPQYNVCFSPYLEELNPTQELDFFQPWTQFLQDSLMADDIPENPHDELNNDCYMFEPISSPIEPLSGSACSTSLSDLDFPDLENGSSQLNGSCSLDFNSFALPCTDLKIDLSVMNSLQPEGYILEDISAVESCDRYDDRNCLAMSAGKVLAEICDVEQPQQQCSQQSSKNNLDELWELFDYEENSEDLAISGLTKEEYEHIFVDSCN